MLYVTIKKKGFTLIEFLITIAVICLILAMMFPLINRAIDSGRAVNCTNNMKLLTTAWFSYSDDNYGFAVEAMRLRLDADVYNSAHSQWWYTLKDYSDMNAYICPSDSLPNNWGTLGNAYIPEFPISYGYSGVLGNGAAWRRAVTGLDSVNPALIATKRIAHFRGHRGAKSSPSQAFFLFDYSNQPNIPKSDNNKVSGNISYGMGRLSARHNGGENTPGIHFPYVGAGNFAFVDGHVKTLAAPFAVGQFSNWLPFSTQYDYAGCFIP